MNFYIRLRLVKSGGGDDGGTGFGDSKKNIGTILELNLGTKMKTRWFPPPH